MVINEVANKTDNLSDSHALWEFAVEMPKRYREYLEDGEYGPTG